MIFPSWFGGRGLVISVPPGPSFLLQEDLFAILQEDNDKLVIEAGTLLDEFLLQEDLFFILQQEGSRLVLQ